MNSQLSFRQLWVWGPLPLQKPAIINYSTAWLEIVRGNKIVSAWVRKLQRLQRESHIGVEPLRMSKIWGFPGGAVVESLPANAGDTGSSPGLGRSRMPRSNWARGPQLLSLRVWSLCSATGEAAMVRGPRTAMRSGPRLPQLEKALAQKRRPNTAKNK